MNILFINIFFVGFMVSEIPRVSVSGYFPLYTVHYDTQYKIRSNEIVNDSQFSIEKSVNMQRLLQMVNINIGDISVEVSPLRERENR